MIATKRIVNGRTIHSHAADPRAEQSGHVESWLECDCGEDVGLTGFTNTCDGCGRDYNGSGQLLAPREQWGEETGEHPADIGRIK